MLFHSYYCLIQKLSLCMCVCVRVSEDLKNKTAKFLLTYLCSVQTHSNTFHLNCGCGNPRCVLHTCCSAPAPKPTAMKTLLLWNRKQFYSRGSRNGCFLLRHHTVGQAGLYRIKTESLISWINYYQIVHCFLKNCFVFFHLFVCFYSAGLIFWSNFILKHAMEIYLYLLAYCNFIYFGIELSIKIWFDLINHVFHI